MRDHGATDHRCNGNVTRIITGSTGLGDCEWSVTLLRSDRLHIRRFNHRMRFDHVSARFAGSGPFCFSVRVPPEEVIGEHRGATSAR